MKRKIKLISSIFSLALAFTFMSFGVFAAAQRTVTVGGSLGFVADRIDATVVVKSSGLRSTTPGITEGSATNYTANPTSGMTSGTVTFSSTDDNQNQTATFSALNMNESNTFFGVMVKITTPANTRGVIVTAPAISNPSSTHFNVSQTIVGGITTTGGTLAAGGIAHIFYIFSLKSPSTLADHTASSFSVEIKLERA